MRTSENPVPQKLSCRELRTPETGFPRTLLPGNTVNKGERGAESGATGEQTQLPARRKPSAKTADVRVRMLGRHFPLASTLAAARRESINAR
jgi:hypothetical protein